MATPSIGHYRVAFGLFEADLSSGELYRSGRRVPLQEKPFRILARLLDQSGQVVTREELRTLLWQEGTFVDFEEGLDTAVKKLRYALGDSAQNPTFIETIRGHGYRFIAPVTNGTAAPSSANDTLSSVATSSTPKFRVPRNKYLVGLVTTVLMFLAAWGIYRWKWRSGGSDLRPVRMKKLTDNGRVSSVAISPDGRYVVYARHEGHEGNDENLWLHEIATSGDIQLLPSGTGFHGLTFSPTGSSIYFVRSDEKDPFFKYLYTMPTLGGPARKLVTDVDSPVTFSPDGRRFLYERCIQPRNDIELKIANTDGSGERLLATIHDGSGFLFQPGPNWSPDGRTIALPVHITNQHQQWLLEAVSVADGSVRDLYSNSRAIGRPVWLPGGRALIFPHTDEVTHRSQLWTVSLPGGKAQRFTNDLFDYGNDLDLTRDGNTLVAVSSTVVSNVWIAPAANPSAARQVTAEPSPMYDIFEASDGKLLTLNGDGVLWMMHTDGSQRFRFAEVQDVSWPTVCGRFVILTVTEADTVALIRLDRDGTHPTALARGNLWSPACSADGEFLLYATVEQPQRIWKVPIAGGSPQFVADVMGDQLTGNLTVSPDGKLIAYPYTQYGRVPSEGWKIVVLPIEGGRALKQFAVPGGIGRMRWSPAGNGLQYVLPQNGAENLWEQPLAGGARKQLTRFPSSQIFDFNWSLDKTRLLLTRGNVSREVILLKNLN